MEANRIRDKYCTDEKVQVMFSNAPLQVILSKDGYLYLRHNDITIHRYLSDPTRKKMPYASNPSSVEHATHLFKYNQIYVKFTSDRHMRGDYDRYGNTLSFIYFYKTTNGETLLAEAFLKDFKQSESVTKTLTRKELKRFLYSIYKLDAKCIFSPSYGIKYLKAAEEDVTIDNGFLDISDEGIIKLYNSEREHLHRIGAMFDQEARAEPHDIDNVYNIEDIPFFPLVPRGYLESKPYVVTISGDTIEVHELSISFVSENCFKLKEITTKIEAKDIKNELLATRIMEYPEDPDFDE